MQELTERQAEILDFISVAVSETGYPPTLQEICDAMGYRSPNAARDHLLALERKGAVELEFGASRAIRLTNPGGVPVIGRVAAGRPILAEQHIERHLQIDPKLFQPKAHYLLLVRGMSMCDAGILDKDLLAVHRTREARSGQVVVARVDDEVTVKRFRRKSRRLVQLLPENPEFEPIEVDLKETSFAIEGLAVGVIRSGRL